MPPQDAAKYVYWLRETKTKTFSGVSKVPAEEVAASVTRKKLACNNSLSSKHVPCVMQASHTSLPCPQTMEITLLIERKLSYVACSASWWERRVPEGALNVGMLRSATNYCRSFLQWINKSPCVLYALKKKEAKSKWAVHHLQEDVLHFLAITAFDIQSKWNGWV